MELFGPYLKMHTTTTIVRIVPAFFIQQDLKKDPGDLIWSP